MQIVLKNGRGPMMVSSMHNKSCGKFQSVQLFSNSQAGARASANLYSLIETAKANGIEPYAYLKVIFTDLPKAQSVEDIDALLPWNSKDNLK